MMRFFRFIFFVAIAAILSMTASAQSWSSLIAKGNSDLSTYNRSVSSGSSMTLAYKSAYSAADAFSQAIKSVQSDSPEYRECRKALRELFPIMSDAAYYFANAGDQEKVLQYACMHVDISLLSAFADEGLQNYPSYPVLANLAATNLFNRGEYGKASEYFKAYLNTTDLSNRELAFEGLARCFYEQKDYDWAAYIAAQGSGYYPSNWNMLLIGIESYGNSGEDDKMGILLDRALSMSPDHSGLLEYKGKLLERQKNFKDASGVYRKLYSMDSHSMDYALHLGFNLYNEATSAIQRSKAPGMDKSEVVALSNYAKSYFLQAAPILQSVLDSSPYAANVARSVAMCYAMSNDAVKLQKANETITAMRGTTVRAGDIPTLDMTYKPTKETTPISEIPVYSNPVAESYPSSDVDINIPVTGVRNDKTYAVVIGNEKYKHHAAVPYAHNDCKVFAEYCNKVLGIPDDNIRICYDATLAELKEQVNYLSKRTDISPDEISIIFYYAGHGLPDVANSSAYLLPSDASGTDMELCFSLNGLYDSFDKMPAKEVTVFLDACFSGATRSNEMLFAERFVEFEVEDFVAKGTTVVFSATNGKQTAMGYDEQKHGFFTYYLLKSLQESKGTITLKNLADNLQRNVEAKALDKKNKRQTPKVTPSPALGDSWHSRTLL